MSHDYQQPSEDQVARLNEATHYAAYSVYRLSGDLPGTPAELAAEIAALADRFAGDGLVIRGFYDVSTLRADADLMVWWHAPEVETLQSAAHALRRTELGRVLEPVWSSVGIHRPAEFNRAHLPAFLTDDNPSAYVCVYPFVRSYEWYLLPEAERRTMLRDHGMAAAGFKDIKAHTISAFALGDYEWLLAFEADELARIVDLMRELRATEARRHVREEIPFFTGPRRELEDFLADYR